MEHVVMWEYQGGFLRVNERCDGERGTRRKEQTKYLY